MEETMDKDAAKTALSERKKELNAATIPFGEETRKSKCRKTLYALLITMLLLIITSSIAWGIASNGGQYRYYKGNLIASDAKGVGLNYIVPKDCSDSNPYPVVILNHGAGSQGYQELPFAMELSRRGYAVVYGDRFDTGESDIANMQAFDQDQQTTMLRDVVQYVASQDWCDGRIAVAGFSQGGSRAAAAYTEFNDLVDAVIFFVSATSPLSNPFPPEGADIIGVAGNWDHYGDIGSTIEAWSQWTGEGDNFKTDTVYGGELGSGNAAVLATADTTHEFMYTSHEGQSKAWDYLQQSIPTGTNISGDNFVFDTYYFVVDICMVLFIILMGLFAYWMSLLPAPYRRIYTGRAAYKKIGAGMRVLSLVLALVVPLVLYGLFCNDIWVFGAAWNGTGSSGGITTVFNSGFINGAVIWFLLCSIITFVVIFVIAQVRKSKGAVITAEDWGGGIAGKDKFFDWHRIGWALLIGAATTFVGFVWMGIEQTITGLGYCNTPYFSFVRETPDRFFQTLPYVIPLLFCFITLNIGLATVNRLPSAGNKLADTILHVVYVVFLAIFPMLFLMWQRFGLSALEGQAAQLFSMENIGDMLMLTGICPMPVTLGAGMAVSVILYRKTGNIWLGTFVSSLFVTFFMFAYVIMSN